MRFADAAEVLREAGPALLAAPGEAGFWALVRTRGAQATLIDGEGRLLRVRLEQLRAALCASLEASPAARSVDQVLERAGVPERRRARARLALLHERIGQRPAGSAWLLRLPAAAPMRHLLSEAGVFRHLAHVLVAHGAEFLLAIVGWWLVGLGALEGRFEAGWLAAWSLLLITAIPVRVAAVRAAARLSIAAGAAMKRRLLAGALSLEPEEVRHQGAGQLLGRVLESDAVESLMLTGGLAAAVAGLQLVLSVPVLAAGAAPGWHLALFAVWTGAAVLIAFTEWRWRKRWTTSRLQMTHDLVERMVGHRTRLAQEPRASWHDEEDRLLEGYLTLSAPCDEAGAVSTACLHRGWLLLGVLGLAPVFLAGEPAAGAMAVSLGGVVLGAQGWRQLAAGLSQLMGAALSFQSVRPLFSAVERERERGSASNAEVGPELPSEQSAAPLEIRDLRFRFPGRVNRVLNGCSLTIRPGDRLLLDGPSGSGKTALAAVLAGLRRPESGLVLWGGVDQETLGGPGWRRRVAYAPQFHENHVLSGTLAFNLLLGRGWPPTASELQEAEGVCRELGLGPLLERMPAGLQQTVGETGWQLSHGECGRLFIARGLLQRPDLLILDESFASLDPENLEQALQCVLSRVKTVLLVAHP
ncbi:MAG: ABC transporter ATP-binding protein [Deltaproteobacteria bacterium]|nr:ABC transporter ATP-binding protein [Deltaproteobacteria bacterium]